MEIKSPPRPAQGPRKPQDPKRPQQDPKRPQGKRQIPTWVLLWGVIVLIVLVVFLANKGAIDEALKNTGFINAIGTQNTVQVVRQTAPQGAIPLPSNSQPLPLSPEDPSLATLLQKPADVPKPQAEQPTVCLLYTSRCV